MKCKDGLQTAHRVPLLLSTISASGVERNLYLALFRYEPAYALEGFFDLI
jgi:hypothetical protein